MIRLYGCNMSWQYVRLFIRERCKQKKNNDKKSSKYVLWWFRILNQILLKFRPVHLGASISHSHRMINHLLFPMNLLNTFHVEYCFRIQLISSSIFTGQFLTYHRLLLHFIGHCLRIILFWSINQLSQINIKMILSHKTYYTHKYFAFLSIFRWETS